MATATTRYGLRKPDATEEVDVELDLNANWDIIDAALGGVSAVKTADLSVLNSVALTSAGLSVTVAANATYSLDGLMIYSAATAGDAQFSLTVPTGATWQLTGRGQPAAATGTSGSIDTAVISSGGVVVGGAGTGVRLSALLSATIVVADTPGSVAVLFAQATASGTDSVLHAGSRIRLARI